MSEWYLKPLYAWIAAVAFVGVGAAAGRAEPDLKTPTRIAATETARGDFDQVPTPIEPAPARTTEDDMVAWAAEAMPLMTDLVDTMDGIAVDAENADVVDMIAGCRQLREDIDALRAVGPVPMPEVDAHFGQSLDYLDRAADSCVSFGVSGDLQDLEDCARYAILGGEEMDLAATALLPYQ